MIGRKYTGRRNRTKIAPGQSPVAPAATPTITLVATKAQIVFSVPVVVNGLPTTITRQAAGAGAQLPPTSMTVDSPTQITLTYAASCVVTDVITVPANVAQIRTFQGGYTAAAVKTF